MKFISPSWAGLTGWRSVFAFMLLCGLLLSVCVVNGFSAPGPVTNNIEFFHLLPKAGSLQWETNQRWNQERNEARHERVFIPAAVASSVPVDARAFLINGRNEPPLARSVVSPGASTLDRIFIGAIFLLAGYLFIRQFAPGFFVTLNECFNPWSVTPAAQSLYLAQLLAAENRRELGASPEKKSPKIVKTPEMERLEFVAALRPRLARFREKLREIERFANVASQKRELVELCFEVAHLKDEAGFPDSLPVRQVVNSLEGLLKELAHKSPTVAPATIRLVARGLDLLQSLCLADGETDRPLKFLVVDDNLTSRYALSFALNKACGKPDLAIDGEEALVRAKQQAYDAIFLDVQLPGMDGFEVCSKIRGTTLNHSTPIVFVTGHNDARAQAEFTRSGGNDLMDKPFLIFEVTVKALTLALPARLNPGAQRRPLTEAVQPGVKGFGADRSGHIVGQA